MIPPIPPAKIAALAKRFPPPSFPNAHIAMIPYGPLDCRETIRDNALLWCAENCEPGSWRQPERWTETAVRIEFADEYDAVLFRLSF